MKIELIVKIGQHSGYYEVLKHALTIISPILELLNKAKSDRSNWQVIYKGTKNAAENARNSGYEILSNIVYPYLPWLENLATIAIRITEGDIDFPEEKITKTISRPQAFSSKSGSDFAAIRLKFVM